MPVFSSPSRLAPRASFLNVPVPVPVPVPVFSSPSRLAPRASFLNVPVPMPVPDSPSRSCGASQCHDTQCCKVGLGLVLLQVDFGDHPYAKSRIKWQHICNVRRQVRWDPVGI